MASTLTIGNLIFIIMVLDPQDDTLGAPRPMHQEAA